jgi:hypothetical protein
MAIRIEYAKVTFSAASDNTGAALIITNLPAEIGDSIEFQVLALTGEKEKGTLRAANTHPMFETLSRKPGRNTRLSHGSFRCH